MTSRKATPRLARAASSTVFIRWERSALSLFMNLARAGVLKNRSAASMVVPFTGGAGSSAITRPPSPALKEVIFSRETAKTEYSASPRKPKVASE